MVNAAWGARMRESDDTPLGIGKSMDTNRDLSSLNSWGLPSPNQMTMSFWIKFWICWLMLRFIKQGPSSLHTGKYHFELPNKADKDAGEQL